MAVRSYDLVPADVQAALTQFSERFMQRFAELQEPALVSVGIEENTNASKVTYPFPVYAPEFKQFTGEMWFRALGGKSLSLIPDTFQDGVKILAKKIESVDWVGWGMQPEAMAEAAMVHKAQLIAAALDAGTSVVTPWDGLAHFHTAHFINPGKKGAGTFANYVTGRAASLENLKTAKAELAAIPNAAGRPMGQKLTHVICPTALEGTFEEIRNNTYVVASGTVGPVENLLKGSFTIIATPTLSDLDDWYVASVQSPADILWVLLNKGTPEEIIQDKSSGLYATSLEVAYAVLFERVVGLGDPHKIIRYRGT